MRTFWTCFVLFTLSNLVDQTITPTNLQSSSTAADNTPAVEQSLVSNIFYERDSNDVYFQILSPENLRYTYKAKQAVFGKPFAVNETARLTLTIIEPNNGCNSIMGSKLELANNVGLIMRGGCSFLDKCIEAERSGLKAILVYDNNSSNDDKYLDMIADNTKRNCSISAAFILGKDGAMIKRQMLYLGLYSVPIQFVNISRLPEEQKINPPWSLY